MQPEYDETTGNLRIWFHPDESEEGAVLLQLVMEEQQERGEDVPLLSSSFFRDIATARQTFPIDFGFKYLGFVLLVIKEAVKVGQECEVDTFDLEQFVDFFEPLILQRFTETQPPPTVH